MKTVKTTKGTQLPLTNLKGKDYLMVAYRIQWMNEEVPNFSVATNILRMDKDESIVQAIVTLKNDKGEVTKTATATKREDSKGFADHLEKAETAAVGRALAMLGYGTQFALSDLDEGERLADSPLVASKAATESAAIAHAASVQDGAKKSTFKKPTNGAATKVEGWD